MKIAVLSGKGGVGKTFVATSLAATIKNSVFVDCDVEEPNGRLFLPCESVLQEDVSIALPSFDKQKCVHCRRCVEFCKFNALAFIKGEPRVFKEVCHSCGACELICTHHAVGESFVKIGVLEIGRHGDTTVITGEMNTGEATGVPIIKKAIDKAYSIPSPCHVIDCPPGSACSVSEGVGRADYCIMVAEPTVFGVHNLKMVIELVKAHKKPFGIIINKYEGEFPQLQSLCEEESAPVIAKIPFKKEYAAAISSGHLLIDEFEEIEDIFIAISKKIGGAE